MDLSPTLIGVISDTHGLLRDEALSALDGVAHIIHAGDVGGKEILDRLTAIAPVSAVRGNTDFGESARSLPPTDVVDVGGALVYVLHDLLLLDIDPAAGGFAAVITGHTHKPSIERRGNVLFLNPGSAGPRRFNLPVSVALIRVSDQILEPEIIDLSVGSR